MKPDQTYNVARRAGRVIFVNLRCRSCGKPLPDSELYINCCTDCYVKIFAGPANQTGRENESN